MAILYRARLHPTKLQLIEGFISTQPWFAGDSAAELTNVAAYRFDDPDGEVGIETVFVRAGDGPLLQVALTYRDAPLEGGGAWLIGTAEHSVLGTRWVYDAIGDPVYLAAVANAAFSGGRQADQYVDIEGELTLREPTGLVVGSGAEGSSVPPRPSIGEVTSRQNSASTTVEAGELHVIVARIVGTDPTTDRVNEQVITGTWPGQDEPVTLLSVAWSAAR